MNKKNGPSSSSLEIPSPPFAINSPLFLAPGCTDLSFSISLAWSRIPYKGHHTACSLWGWFLSLSIMFLRFINVVCYPIHCLNSIHCKDVPQVVYPFLYLYTFGLFQCGALLNEAALIIHEQAFVWLHVFTSLGQIPRIGIGRSIEVYVLLYEKLPNWF